MFWALSKAKKKIAFVASCLYICGMLVGAALALYPGVLPSSVDPVYSLSIYNTAAAHHGLTRGHYVVARRDDSGTGIFRVYLSPIRWEDPKAKPDECSKRASKSSPLQPRIIIEDTLRKGLS